MRIRKIFKIGRFSYVVTLPKDWVQTLPTLEVVMFYNDVLLMLPKSKQYLAKKAVEQAIKKIVQG